MAQEGQEVRRWREFATGCTFESEILEKRNHRFEQHQLRLRPRAGVLPPDPSAVGRALRHPRRLSGDADDHAAARRCEPACARARTEARVECLAGSAAPRGRLDAGDRPVRRPGDCRPASSEPCCVAPRGRRCAGSCAEAAVPRRCFVNSGDRSRDRNVDGARGDPRPNDPRGRRVDMDADRRVVAEVRAEVVVERLRGSIERPQSGRDFQRDACRLAW
jgi:hypothetical protein